MNKLINLFAALGWIIAPPSLARSMGSAQFALASFSVPGATWRIRVGSRVTSLERRSHVTPSGRTSVGHWEHAGTVETPCTVRAWRDLADALTGEALAFESAIRSGGLTRLPSGSEHTRRRDSGGRDASGPGAARGRVGRSNPSRLDAFGFAPAAGFHLLGGFGELVDATGDLKAHHARIGFTAEAKRIAARKARRNARRKAQRARKVEE